MSLLEDRLNLMTKMNQTRIKLMSLQREQQVVIGQFDLFTERIQDLINYLTIEGNPESKVLATEKTPGNHVGVDASTELQLAYGLKQIQDNLSAQVYLNGLLGCQKSDQITSWFDISLDFCYEQLCEKLKILIRTLPIDTSNPLSFTTDQLEKCFQFAALQQNNIQVRDKVVKALFCSAKHHEKAGRVQEALAMYNQALKFHPQMTEALRASAQLAFDRGDYQEAIKNYKKCDNKTKKVIESYDMLLKQIDAENSSSPQVIKLLINKAEYLIGIGWTAQADLVIADA